MKISAYWKGVIAALAPVLATVQALAEDGKIDVSDGVTIGGAVLIALGVWRVPNSPQEPRA